MNTVKYNGKKLKLIQDAYLDYNTIHGDHYRAIAREKGKPNKDYLVIWEITNPDGLEENACHWNQYEVVEV